MAEPESASQDSPSPSPFRRRVISVLLAYHVLAVLIYLGPTTEERVEVLPAWMSVPLLEVSRAVWSVASPVVMPYVRTFNLKQDWRLFGPRPSRWTTTVDVIAFYPEDPSDPLSIALWEAAGDSSATRIPWPDSVRVDPDRWVRDSIRLEWGGGGSFPKFMHQREHRLAYNLGLTGFFESYGAIFARWQCLQLEGPHGRGPDGVQILADWVAIDVPWKDPEPEFPPNFMGGFTCPALLAVEVE